jgi:hypothetical protein
MEWEGCKHTHTRILHKGMDAHFLNVYNNEKNFQSSDDDFYDDDNSSNLLIPPTFVFFQCSREHVYIKCNVFTEKRRMDEEGRRFYYFAGMQCIHKGN